MATLTKKYRLFWITETKEIINNYEDNYDGSITLCPDDGPNSFIESNNYQVIINKINSEGLKEREIIIQPPPPIE